MTLALTTALGSGQTATSAASALAARNRRYTVRQFCADVHINFTDVINGEPRSLTKLAHLGDFDLTALTKSSFILEERRTFTLNGQRLVGSMLERQGLVCCPVCLVEDMENGTYTPEINAFARAEWSVTSYRTCIKHDVAIVSVGPMPHASDTHDFAVLVRQDLVQIRRLAADPVGRKISAFERNFLSRLQGDAVEQNWLNSVGFSAAARACEIFGAVSLFGTRPKLTQLTDDEWARAGAAGFELVKGGIETARDFLFDLQNASDLGASSGPQQMFGRIYQWLEFGSEDRELEPVRTMLRDHIVETLPVGPGDTVLGREVRQRRIHSIRSAALQYGIHQKTTRKVLTLAGIARAERDDLLDNKILFPSEMADALMARIARGIPIKEIRAYLDISRTHLKHLVAEGYIQPILDMGGLDPLYDTTDLDAFVEEITVKSETVQFPKSDQVSLAEAVRRACCSVVEVLNLVWRQGLDWTGKLEGARGYGALLVSLEEVRTKTQLPALDGIVTQRISKDFGIPSEAAQAIVQSGFLRTVDAINQKNRCPVKLIPHEEYRRFTDTYISLRDLSRDRGMWSRHLIPELEAARIYPLPEWKDFGGYIYRRDQVT